ARDKPAEATVGHVDEAGAVDAVLGHSAPEVRGAEVGAGLGYGVALRTRLRQPRRSAWQNGRSQSVVGDPAWVVVGRADSGPAVSLLLDGEGLAAERLRHLLARRVRVGMDRRDVRDAGASVGHPADDSYGRGAARSAAAHLPL